MNIERKEVTGPYAEYEKFGWKVIGQKEVIHHRTRGRTRKNTVYLLSRDKDMKNYSGIVQCENAYFSAKTRLKKYEPIDPLICLLTFLILVIPGIIYVAFKTYQKNKIYEFNNNIVRNLKGYEKRAKELMG